MTDVVTTPTSVASITGPLPAEPKISVIICAFASARWGWLVAAVESIRQQSVAALETIVVVDHNAELLSQVRDSMADVRAIANAHERGAGGARNTGVAQARGEVVAFLDDDARAVPDWLERIKTALADDEHLGVGGEVIPDWLVDQPPWFPREFRWVVGCSYEGQPTRPTVVRNLMAGNMAVHREVFRSLGGYRAGHGNLQPGTPGDTVTSRFVTRQSGCEETEFCIRASVRWQGRTWLYDPDVAIHHCVPPARTRLRYFFARCNDEGLAKASVVVRFAGAERGLASEREYVTSVLPRAVVVGLRQGLRGDPWGPARSLVVMAGLAVTVIGYARGRLGLTLLGNRTRPVGAASETASI